MARYIALPIVRDPAEAEEQSFEVLRTQWPGWEPDAADPMTMLLRAAAVMYSDVAELATRMGEESFRYFGRGLVNLPPVDETSAIGVVTITAQDADGPYVVPEDLELAGRGPGGEQVGFRTIAAAVIPNGETTVDVDVEATEQGTASNAIGGVAEFLEYIDYLTAAEFVGETAGATDREADDTYLDRLAGELELQSPRPILPRDFAVLARRLAGAGYRATAIDGLNPDDDTTDNERFVAVSIVDPAGLAPSDELMDAVSAALEALREQNFRCPVFAPTFTTIDAGFAGTALPGWDPLEVQASAITQVTSYLTGSRWGLRPDTGDALEWRNIPIVRWGEVYEQLQRVEGLEFVDELGIAVSGDPLGGIGENVVMDGYAALPVPGDITGVVTAGTE